MADENAFLQYDEGFVLHNGLPVKWVTAASAITKWEDFDLIIERVRGTDTYFNGFTIPYTYSGMSGFVNYSSPTPRTTMTDATARWGTEIAVIDGDVKMKTNKYMSCDIDHCEYTGRGTRISGYPVEGQSGQYDIYGYKFPNRESFFIGVKFGNGYGVPSMPDLTNFGSGAPYYSVIHKLNAPNATDFMSMMNASNYTAMKNVYMPSGSLRMAGINGLSDAHVSNRHCEYFENIYMPVGYIEDNYGSSGTWTACRFNDVTAKDVTAARISVPGLSGVNLRCTTIKFTSGKIDDAVASSLLSAGNNTQIYNTTANELDIRGGSAYSSTFSSVYSANNEATFDNCRFEGTSSQHIGNFTYTNCYFKDTIIGGNTAKTVKINNCSGDKVTLGTCKISGNNCTFDYVNSLKINSTNLKNSTFSAKANTAELINTQSAAGIISAATNNGVLVRDTGYASKITAYDCKPNSYNRRSQLPTWSANEFHYKDEIGNQVGNGVLYGNKTYVSGAGTANNLYAGGGTGRYTSADLRNVNFNYGGNRIYLYSGVFIVTSAQTATNSFYYSTSSPYYSRLVVSG